VNIDLTAQNSIVPTARNLTRFKVFGKLPSLHVNFSDSKYKLLMRLIDVAIPHFDGNDAADNHRSDHMAVESERRLQDLRLRTGIFAQEQSDFTIDYDPEDETQQSPSRSEVRQPEHVHREPY
jgi:vacuolar protein sorting-associated protein 13A/C